MKFKFSVTLEVGVDLSVIGLSSGWIAPIRKLATYIRDDFKCVLCGIDCRGMDPNLVTLDHIVSKKEYRSWSKEQQEEFGSVHKTSNLVLACKSCNSSKKANGEWLSPEARDRVAAAVAKHLDLERARQILEAVA